MMVIAHSTDVQSKSHLGLLIMTFLPCFPWLKVLRMKWFMTQFLMVFLLKLPGCVAVGLSTCSLVIDKSKKDIICRVIFLSRVDGIIVVLIVTTCMASTLLYLTLAKLGFSLSCKDCLQVRSLSFSCVCSITEPQPSGFSWKSQYLAKHPLCSS